MRFGFFRGVVVLGAALLIGLALYLIIKRTRFGKIVRAGVDDRDMVSALGINVSLVFIGAFFLGALLAGLGGVLGGTMISLAPGQDTAFLLNSLIVVIIGGMGSLGGAAIGALALGLVDAYADVYLVFGGDRPDELLDHRHVRAAGRRARRAAARALREAGMNPTVSTNRLAWPVLAVVVVLAAIAPLFVSDFFLNVILTKALWLGIAAASLIFLAAYGGMVSLAQVGIYGVAGMTYANLVLADGGAAAAWNPYIALVAALVVATVVGLGFGWIAARSEGIYFLMITLAFSVLVFYFFSQVTQLSGFGGVNSVDLPGIVGNPESDPVPRYFLTLVVAVLVFLWLARAVAHRVRAGPPGRPRRAGPHARARLRRHAAPDARVRHRGLRRRHRGRAVRLLQRPHHAGVDQPGADDRRADRRRHRRPLPARGRLDRRAHLRTDRQLLASVGARGRQRPRPRTVQHADRRAVPDHRPGLARRHHRHLGAGAAKFRRPRRKGSAAPAAAPKPAVRIAIE